VSRSKKEFLKDTCSTFVNIDSSGKGSKIVKQSPAAGTKVKEGSKIRVYLSEE